MSRIDFLPTATPAQRAAAQAILDAFDPAAEEAAEKARIEREAKEAEFARKHLPAIAQALVAAKVALPKELTDDLAAVLAAREND